MSSNEICQLTIGFNGICTHFRDVVPDVPHRVVLGNAYQVRFGMFQLLDPGIDINYCLLPHFPQLTGNGIALQLAPLIVDGDILTPVRLQLKNAIDSPLHYEETYALVPQVADFVPEYLVSEEVVFGGRAACYLDVFAGTISATPANGITRVTITVATDGPPTFVVTPISSAEPLAELTLMPVNGNECEMTLASIEREPEEYGYDFLLHYLTSARGIPRTVTKPLLGMPPQPAWMTPTELQTRLAHFAEDAGVGWPYFGTQPAPRSGQISPACSDTRYP